MFQLRHLKTFIAAAETLSFTAAAARVHLTQPSVSEQIQALEAQAGHPLFLRQNNRLALTPAGERLLRHAHHLVAAAEAALADVKRGTSGPDPIRFAAPATLGQVLLAPALAPESPHDAVPPVAWRECNTRATLEAVLRREVDFGVVHGRPPSCPGIHMEAIGHDHAVAVLPAAHGLAAVHAIEAADLARSPLLLTRDGCVYRAFAQQVLQPWASELRHAGEADSVGALLALVRQGRGIAVLPSLALAGKAAEGIAWRRLAGVAALPITLVTPLDAPPLAQVSRLLHRLRAASDEAVPALDVQHGARRESVGHQE